MAESKAWDKVFPKSHEVSSRKVTFQNRFGITLTGDLYIPKESVNNRLQAIAVSGPFGAVKEQASGFYAQSLAARGFITLAFDPSYTGESSGAPRNTASPDINTEDFSAAVDYLSNRKDVNADRIGVLGICGFGGFALNAAAADTRIKACVTVTMYDITRLSSRDYYDRLDEQGRFELKERLSAQRTIDFKNGKYAPAQGLPDRLTGDEPQMVKDYWGYYKTERGFHKRSINSNGHWNITSAISLMNQPILQFSSEIRSAVLMIHGANAHSRYFTEDAFRNLRGDNKELLIVEDANHTDLYDNASKIPFSRIESFYKTAFASNGRLSRNMQDSCC